MAAHSLTAAINTWLEADLIAQQFQAAWPDRLHIITYEALTESPQSALSAALNFIGEPCETLVGIFRMCTARRTATSRADGHVGPQLFDANSHQTCFVMATFSD